MTNFDKMEQNFVALTWKLIGGVAALATASAGAGIAAGYYANRS